MKTSPSFVDSPLYHHKNEENQISVKEMEICKTEQNSLLSYLSQFDYKISNTLNRQRTLINGRYLTMMNHLEKVRKQLEIYENKVNSLEKEIDENEKIKKIIIELNIQKKYHDLLENKMNQLFGVMQINQKELKENLELIKLKKNTIFQVNHQNLLYEERIRKLKTFINRKKNILPKIKGNTNILNSNSSVINTTFEGHSKNNFSISYNEKVLDLKNGIKDKMAAFFGIKQLFEECFQLQIKQFTKSQQVIKENGLKDSLLFQIKTKNNEFDKKNKPNLQDREIKTVVWSTLKELLKKYEKNKDSDNFYIPLTDFLTMNSLQIMAFICIKPEVIKFLKSEFYEKESNLNLIFNNYRSILC